MSWSPVVNRRIAVSSVLIWTLTSCGTSEDNEIPVFTADRNTKARSRIEFWSDAFESNDSSESNNETISMPMPLNTFYTGGRNRRDHLVLTPYIKNKRFREGARAAQVRPPLLHGIRSFSGFFEVDESHNSYMFFLLYRCTQNLRIPNSKIPIILWMQGGTGSSSMHGAFRGNGPIRLENNGSLTYNKYSWAKKAHLVYFDNPVGAGYSYTLKKGFSRNMHEVATNLYSALKQLLTLFRLNKNPLYIASQGFGGKYVTALGAMIDRENESGKMNFQGVVIGNGFIDPPNMLRYGAYMYQLGFIDSRVRNAFGAVRRRIVEKLAEGNHEEALELYEKWLQAGSGRGNVPQIRYITGLPSLLNYETIDYDLDEGDLLNSVFNDHPIMKALHSGVPYASQNSRCKRALRPVVLHSQVENLKLLMNKYRVLLYHGQLSVKNAYPFMLDYLSQIEWNGKKHYNENKRVPWKVDGKVAGYHRTGGFFTELMIRNAGQMVPTDQPKWSQRMINNFIQQLPLNTDHD